MLPEPGTRAAVMAAALRLLPFCMLYGFSEAQIHYSIPEELKRGAFVGNIAKDLGTDVAKLTAAHLQVLSDSDSQYFSVNVNTGVITVNDRIDREQLCGQSSQCLLNLKLAIENPVEVYSIEVEILDVNDNPPRFQSSEFTLNVNELASPGARFLIQNAQDPDTGSNSLQTYHLSPNENFSLKVKTRADGNKFPELVLERALDREQRAVHHLVLTAEDGGAPRRTSTLNITVNVLDANDNHPVFDKPSYKASLVENIAKGTLVVRLNATDLDEGPNGEIEYSFSSHNSDALSSVFTINGQTGEIRIIGDLDYEEVKLYEIDIEAKDNGSPIMEEHCTVTVEVIDVNDNRPEITLVSLAKSITEDAPPGTVVAVVNINDRDSGKNGMVNCHLPSNLPFTMRKDFEHQYSLITNSQLDRESVSRYNFSITATDMGNPPLMVKRELSIMLSDVNDSPPEFIRPSYEVFLKENNKVGELLCTVSALDPDLGQNALLSYSILRGHGENSDTSAFPVYINSRNGQVYAELPFDYEKISYFQFRVEVTDAGSPPLSSRTTVHVFILDQNDNVPIILYPTLGKDTDIRCQIPRSIGAKKLVTKVTAVDPDAGRNAWVSYHLLKATDPKLFTVGLRTGEIRTTRVLQDQDAPIQELLLVIKDSGEPTLSTSVTVLVSVEDNGLEIFQGLHDVPTQSENIPTLTIYLIISLAIISVIALIGLVALGIRCAGNRANENSYCCCLEKPRKPIDPTKRFLEHVQLHHSLGHAVIGVQVSSMGNVPSAPCRSCISPVSDISEFMFMKTSTGPPSCPPSAQLPEPSCSSAPNEASSLNMQAKGMLPASQAHSAF
ncbi:protocadherin gamma-C4-like [Pleurodeles waltl]|uniref:protocadherin gamma-C4-like n=1 Tax=Pleurodeles waltl TaxID=8319 RepID=UPI0037093C86